MLYDGKTASVFLKNGYELELTLDTEAFDETISLRAMELNKVTLAKRHRGRT